MVLGVHVRVTVVVDVAVPETTGFPGAEGATAVMKTSHSKCEYLVRSLGKNK